MNNPYHVLNVETSADNETIKRAYLAQVKAHPPDHAPTRFQAVRQAYEAIKTEKDRLAYALFCVDSPDPSALCRDIIEQGTPARPDAGAFRRMLSESLQHYRFRCTR